MKTLRLFLFGAGISAVFLLSSQAGEFILFEGDGSNEPGFVPPKPGDPPPAPRSSVSSAETFIAAAAPVTPQSRAERKNQPSPPVMFSKLRSDRGRLDWAARPNDLNNLLRQMKDLIDVDFAMEVKAFGEISTDPERNPILYRSGNFNFELSSGERERLREYLLNGGMIIFNTSMGSKPFYNSARREMEALFPEASVRRLAPDDPIFHAYYDLSRVDYRPGARQAGQSSQEPWFEGVTIDCRTVAVISRWCMATGWERLDDDSLQAYAPDSAVQLGINLLSYATAQRAWVQNLARTAEYIDAETDLPSTGAMKFAQIAYDGEWKTRHAGPSVLLQQFHRHTEIPVRFERRELTLTDPELFDMPLVYLTGHDDFRLSEGEVANLRRYLRSGGLLFAEACCGRAAFDQAFRREMARVLPGQTLTPLPSEDPIFVFPHDVRAVGVTPALAARMGDRSRIRPELLGVRAGLGHSVIYSPIGLSGGWELSPDPYSHGLDSEGSLAVGMNILLHALTQ